MSKKTFSAEIFVDPPPFDRIEQYKNGSDSATRQRTARESAAEKKFELVKLNKKADCDLQCSGAHEACINEGL